MIKRALHRWETSDNALFAWVLKAQWRCNTLPRGDASITAGFRSADERAVSVVSSVKVRFLSTREADALQASRVAAATRDSLIPLRVIELRIGKVVENRLKGGGLYV